MDLACAATWRSASISAEAVWRLRPSEPIDRDVAQALSREAAEEGDGAAVDDASLPHRGRVAGAVEHAPDDLRTHDALLGDGLAGLERRRSDVGLGVYRAGDYAEPVGARRATDEATR